MGATCVTTEVTGHEEYVEHGVQRAGLRLGRRARHGPPARPARPRPRLLHALRFNALETARAWPTWEQSGEFMAGALHAIRRDPPPDVRRAAPRLLADVRAGMEAVAHGVPAPRRAAPGRCRRCERLRRAAGHPPVRSRSHGSPGVQVVLKALHPITRRGQAAPAGAGDEPAAARAGSARPATLRVPRPAGAARRAARRARAARARRRGGADGPLEVAVVVPQFRRGSGGHTTIADLVRGLEARGHALIAVGPGRRGPPRRASPRRDRRAVRAVLRAGARAGPRRASARWAGADVVVATGWQTVPRVLRAAGRRRARLPRAGPRARVLRHLGRARVGRVDLPPGPALHLRVAVAGRARARPLRRVGHVASTSASTTTATTRCPSPPPRRPRALLRPRR